MPHKRKANRICPRCKERTASTYSSYCKPCACEKQKEHLKKSGYESNKKYRDKIRKLVIEAKNKPCEDCGKTYPHYVMDLDHVRGIKKFVLSIAGSKKYSLKTVQEEIDKCDVVCSNCHRERTFNKPKPT